MTSSPCAAVARWGDAQLLGSAPSAANGGIDDSEFDENYNGIFELPL